jgi:uncharacterized repeat protein (TIGR03803 family)
LAEVIEGSDGALYGTTRDAGLNDNGIVFKVNKDGSDYAVLVKFDGAGQGSSPYGGVVEAGDGKLYGLTSMGGEAGYGTLFRLNKDGGGFETLHSFIATSSDGRQPEGNLLLGRDGALYGTTYYGGANGAGSVFRIQRDGTGFTLLHSFDPYADGQFPTAGLAQGTNDLLYGVTSIGGYSAQGTLFSVDTNGASFTVLHPFGASGDGQSPYSGLVRGPGGVLYGTTYTGASQMNGVIFEINEDGSGYALVHEFNGGVNSEGYRPEGLLWLSGDGFFYGTTSHGGLANIGTIYRVRPDGSGNTRLLSFSYSGRDGTDLSAPPLPASDGKLYGVAFDGGANEAGSLFTLNPDGSGYAVLHDFSWETDDGSNPLGALLEGKDGVLYGTTGYGGGTNQGTIFKMNKDGSGYSILRRFTGVASTGARPSAALLDASDGKLYGRLAVGGDGGGSALFRISKDGSDFALLFSFVENNSWPQSPEAELLEGPDGTLYSTSEYEGPDYEGAIWRINKDGTGYVVLHSFSETGGDGYYPEGGLLQGSDGALYGTTAFGGAFDGGTVFKISPNGTGYTILYSFNRTNTAQGHWPNGTLLEVSRGILVGAAYYGGPEDLGLFYALGTDGSHYTVLHTLVGTEGADPVCGLSRGPDGTLYGTTSYGGDLDSGTVFRMPGLKIGSYIAGGSFHLTIAGSAGQVYAVDATDTLPLGWGEVGRITNQTGTVEWSEPLSGHQRRSYRARWLLP